MTAIARVLTILVSAAAVGFLGYAAIHYANVAQGVTP